MFQLSTRAYTLDLIDHSLVQTCEQFTCELLFPVPSSASLLSWPLLLLFSCFVSLLISFASFLLCLALLFLYSASFLTPSPGFIFPFPLLLVTSVVPSLSRYANIHNWLEHELFLYLPYTLDLIDHSLLQICEQFTIPL